MRLFLFLCCCVSVLACQTPKVAVPELPDNYAAEHEAWQQERMNNLLSPTGWLSMVGLYWLEAGENSCGSSVGSIVKLPASAPAQAATYTLLDGQVTCTPLTANGVSLLDAKNCVMGHGSLRWYLLERGGKHGIRIQDTLLPARIRMAPIPSFALDPAYRVYAQWEAAEAEATVMMRNVLDMEFPVTIEGKVRFTLAGQEHELIALDGGPNELFLIFSDETTGNTTYGGGRYLYCARPDANGRTTIDFNRAYNPPCAFTDFATCLLPVVENNLPIALLCGEKDAH